MLRDFVEHGTHDPEEYPFAEEAHALRRLLATLHALKNWSTAKSQAALNAWQVAPKSQVRATHTLHFLNTATY